VTLTDGGLILGYSATGNTIKEMAPASVSMIEMTKANFGL
jgi:hypothetical protein